MFIVCSWQGLYEEELGNVETQRWSLLLLERCIDRRWRWRQLECLSLCEYIIFVYTRPATIRRFKTKTKRTCLASIRFINVYSEAVHAVKEITISERVREKWWRKYWLGVSVKEKQFNYHLMEKDIGNETREVETEELMPETSTVNTERCWGWRTQTPRSWTNRLDITETNHNVMCSKTSTWITAIASAAAENGDYNDYDDKGDDVPMLWG